MIREDLLRRMRDNEIRAEGYEEGFKQGFEEGQKQFAELIHILLEQGRKEDVIRTCTDPEYRDQLFHEFQIILVTDHYICTCEKSGIHQAALFIKTFPTRSISKKARNYPESHYLRIFGLFFILM